MSPATSQRSPSKFGALLLALMLGCSAQLTALAADAESGVPAAARRAPAGQHPERPRAADAARSTRGSGAYREGTHARDARVSRGRDGSHAGSLFKKAGIQTTDHFRQRLNSRADRGITEKAALRAYREGRLFFDPRSRNYIRHDPTTGISVVTSRATNGRAKTVFEGRPSGRWTPLRWRPGQQ